MGFHHSRSSFPHSHHSITPRLHYSITPSPNPVSRCLCGESYFASLRLCVPVTPPLHHSIEIRPLFRSNHVSNVCSSGLTDRENSRLRAPQKSSLKSRLN
jgi:hypothetical protein